MNISVSKIAGLCRIMNIALDTFMGEYDAPKRTSRGENVVENPARNTRKYSSDGRDRSISVISESDIP